MDVRQMKHERDDSELKGHEVEVKQSDECLEQNERTSQLTNYHRSNMAQEIRLETFQNNKNIIFDKS